MFDMTAYLMGKKNGYAKGEEEGKSNVVIEGAVTCTDPNSDGNVVITEG